MTEPSRTGPTSAPAGGTPTGADTESSARGTSIDTDSSARGTSIGTEVDRLRTEIDRLDREILDTILRRTEVSRRIGAARMAEGGPRIVYSREMAVLDRFAELGPEGRELAMMLLRLGRGRLGSS